jgi:hypothetical protein
MHQPPADSINLEAIRKLGRWRDADSAFALRRFDRTAVEC